MPSGRPALNERSVTFPAVRMPGVPALLRLTLPTALRKLLLLAAVLWLWGCGSTAPTTPAAAGAETAPAAPAKPAMTMRVASLDVSAYRGRVEQKQVDELAGLLKSMKIDLIALQGITRYPGVATRTDLVDALGAATGMRASFGETIAVSGRQSGNAVLSTYPIQSSDNRSYPDLSGNGFEGALQAIVDAGARQVVILSTRLPDPLSRRDLGICTGTLNGIAAEYPKDPLIVMGNLPAAPGDGLWMDTGSPADGQSFSWFAPRGLSARSGRGARCALGELRVADVEIFPYGRP